jgi:hypothetical protein
MLTGKIQLGYKQRVYVQTDRFCPESSICFVNVDRYSDLPLACSPSHTKIGAVAI